MESVRQVLLSKVTANSVAVTDDVETTVRDYARFVYRLAFSVLRNHPDAEDAAQETFVRVLRHRERLPEIRDRKLWLARIAWRVAVDRRKRQPGRSMDEATEDEFKAGSRNPTTEDDLIHEQQLAFVRLAIQTLPKELREVVTLSTVEDLSGAEIAALLHIPEVSVRTRMFRARQILKGKLTVLMGGTHEY